MKVNNTFFTEANFDAVGGRKIDKHLVEKIINDMKKVNFLNKTLVLIIGSNNIRKKGKASDIIVYFEELLKFVNFLKNFRVVVCGIIPSIPDARSKKNFCEASKLLKNMCLMYDCASFCPIQNYLTNNVISFTEFNTSKIFSYSRLLNKCSLMLVISTAIRVVEFSNGYVDS